MQTKHEAPSFWQRHWQKVVGATIWGLLIGSYLIYVRVNNLTTADALLRIITLLQSPYGPLIYILLYAIRPLIFFSAIVLTVSAGAIFGAGSPANFVLALLYTFVASLMSATVAYFVGRFFGKGLIKEQTGDQGSIVQRYTDRMRRNSFETVLIMRFIFLPYDLVSYLAGFLRINYGAFILATWLGSIPGTIAFLSFGASINLADLANGELPSLDPRMLLFGVLIFVTSLVIARLIRRREAQQTPAVAAVASAHVATPVYEPE